MPAQHINADQFDQTLQGAGAKPVMVDFYADWCGPCKMAAPILDKLSEERAEEVQIVKVDVDENNQLAAQHGVMSIPTVIVFKNGQEVARQIGFPGEMGYVKMIEKAAE